MEVTDLMIVRALRMLDDYCALDDDGDDGYFGANSKEAMKAALEAVFDNMEKGEYWNLCNPKESAKTAQPDDKIQGCGKSVSDIFTRQAEKQQKSAQPEPNNEGWIWVDRDVMKCPISPDTRIKARRVDGELCGEAVAGKISWEWTGSGRDIVAYRIIKEEPKEKTPTLLEWLRNQSPGNSPYKWTDREHLILEVVSKYLKYLDKYMMRKE